MGKCLELWGMGLVCHPLAMPVAKETRLAGYTYRGTPGEEDGGDADCGKGYLDVRNKF